MAFTARTIDTIFQELLLEKQTLTQLNGLVVGGITDENSLITSLNNSKVAEWVLWLYNMAVETYLTELRTESAITDIQTIFDNKFVATEQWYIQKALEFQTGDNVIIDPITYQIHYETINTNLQIISSVTVKTYQNKLLLKVRRIDTDLLTVGELAEFISYLNKIKIAGTQVIVYNYLPDSLTLNMTILYSGIKSLTTVKANVEAAINDYIENIEYDSSFLTSKLIDKLQLVDGVIDPRFDSGVAINNLGTTTSFIHQYDTLAGYCAINGSTPLSSTITYISK